MLKIAWKSFRYNIKSFAVFFLSAVFTVMMAFGFLYLGQLTKEIKIEGINSIIGYRLSEAIPVIVVVAMCIMAYTVRFYILSRMKDYSTLLILGIRKKTFVLFIVLEYIFSWILSIVLGLICGNLFVGLFRYLLERLAGDSVSYSVVDVKSLYIKVLLCCAAFIIGVILVIVVYLSEKDLSDALRANKAREKRPVKKIWTAFVYVGVGLIALGIFLSFAGGWLSSRQAAMMQMLMSTGGIYLILQFGVGIWYENRKKRQDNRYYKGMLKWSEYSRRLNANINIVALQVIIGMAICYFIWSVSGGIWVTDPEEYPYDIVCETPVGDGENVKEICDKYSDDTELFPYVEIYERQYSLFGISPKTCEKLWEERFVLKGNEFGYIWKERYGFEQSISEIGLSLGWENRVYNVVTMYDIKETRHHQTFGKYLSDVVVFTEEEFERLWSENEANHMMVTMNAKEEAADQAEQELRAYAKEHPEVKISYKKALLRSERMEGIVRFSIMMFVVIALLFYLLFVLCVKLYSELPIMKEKYRFLRVSGMRTKERKKLIGKEITMFLLPPSFIATAAGFLHCLGYVRYELYKMKQSFHFFAEYGTPSVLWILPQIIVYLLIMLAFTFIMKKLMIRWIEKEQ